MSALKIVNIPESRSLQMRSSGSPLPVSVVRTYGPIAASRRSRSLLRWGMSIAESSRKSAVPFGYVGVPHGMKLDLWPVFFKLVRLHGGPARVRRYLPDLIKLVWDRKIESGRVFDLVLPLEQVAEGYRAIDERRAIKALLRP